MPSTFAVGLPMLAISVSSLLGLLHVHLEKTVYIMVFELKERKRKWGKSRARRGTKVLISVGNIYRTFKKCFGSRH
ncbi:hypothetical protein BT69DRAFT_1288537 [Atractiella rhizophila]|nr:hypothetical protein BT69DRAFT_1288537 [Atractiella rhizophila]